MFVYVIGAGDQAHKIGIAGRPHSRIRELQCGNPHRLELKASFATDELSAAEVEVLAHRLLASLRLGGEWFKVSADEAEAAIRRAMQMLRDGVGLDGATRHADMAPAEFRAALDATGLSARWLAAATGRSPAQGHAWASGRSAVPQPVAEWLRRRMASHQADPPPTLPPYAPGAVFRSTAA